MAHTGGLRVSVIGAGPVGLAFALTLAERDPASCVRVLDRRLVGTGAGVRWQESGRREHVVTIQSRQYMKLPSAVRDALLLAGAPVWPVGPDSVEQLMPVNICVRVCEDVLLEQALACPRIQVLAQDAGDTALVEQGQWADVIVAADGVRSRTAAWMAPHLPAPDSGPFSVNGTEWVDGCIGVRVRSRQAASTSVALTVSQNRYLLNALGGSGFVNMRLAPSEWAQIRLAAGDSSHIALKKLDETEIGERLRSGLSLFDADAVSEQVRVFSLLNRTRARYTARLRASSDTQRELYGAVIGDAAISLHFWPGRGYNSGLAGAVSLASTLAGERGRATLREADLSRHEGAMAMLAHRHTTRAWRAVVCDRDGAEVPYAQLIEEALGQGERDADRDEIVKRALGAAKRLRDRMPAPADEGQLLRAVDGLSGGTARVLAHSRGWAADLMGGPEVDVERLLAAGA